MLEKAKNLVSGKKEEEKKEEKPAEDAGDNEEGKAEPEKIVEMKKGDYTVHFLIEEVKNLVTIKENPKDKECEGKLPFPRVKISCFDQSKRTQEVPKAVDSYVFNEHFYFDKTNLTKEQLDSEKIIIEVYDTKHTDKKFYLGVQEFDFSYIYSKENHCIKNLWIALANPNADDISEVRGYLKFSASVLHENDERVELEMKEATDDSCFVPTQVKINYRQITINYFYAQNIPDMDQPLFGGENKGSKAKCDGYFEVYYLGMKKRTKTVKTENMKCTWNQAIKIPVTEPAVSQKLVMTLFDEESLGKSDTVGSIEFKIEDIRKKKYAQPMFFDIYGSYENAKSKRHNLMNANAEIGSRWKGRVLLSITYEEVEKAIAAVEDIQDRDFIAKAHSTPRKNNWKLMVQVYDTAFLPVDKEKIRLNIAWADITASDKAKDCKDGRVEWKWKNTIMCQTSTDFVEDVPDIFLYIMEEKKEKIICFQRLRAADIFENDKIMAIKLIPEYSNKKLNMMDTGIAKMRIGVFDTDRKNCPEEKFNFGYNPNAAKKPSDDLEDDDELGDLCGPTEVAGPKPQKFTVVAIVYMSKGLLPAEKNGKSDPYVQIRMRGSTRKTKHIENTVNGVWNEMLVFPDCEFVLEDKSTWPSMQLKIFDWNRIESHKVMNYSFIWLCRTSYQIDDVEKMVYPKWYNLFLPKSNKKQGKLLMSFYILSKGKEKLIEKIKVLPETVNYTCEFNLLGLRELQPLSLLPVKKAYIKFDLNSLNFTGRKEDTNAPIVTIPGEPGPNPTINSVFKFDINLPKDEKYIPELQCEVYDHILAGLVNSLLGVFTINVKKIIQKTRKRIDEDLETIKKISAKNIGGALLGKQFTKIQNIAFGEEEGKKEEENDTSKKSGGANAFMEMMSIAKSEDKKTEASAPSEPGKIKDNNLGENLIDEENNPENDAVLKIAASVNKDEEVKAEEKKGDIPEGEVPGPLEQINGVALPNKLPSFMLHDSNYFVRYPYFKNYEIPGYLKNQNNIKDFWVEDESKKPDDNDFIEVGYLQKVDVGTPRNKTKKHYRRKYGKELEKVAELKIKTPFNCEDLHRGNFKDTADTGSIFELMTDKTKQILMTFDGVAEDQPPSNNDSVASGSEEIKDVNYGKSSDDLEEKTYGRFKSLLTICEKDKYEDFKKTVEKYIGNKEYADKLKYVKKNKEISQKMLLRTKIIVRLYVLKLWNLAKKDAFSESDPFIKVYMGGKEVCNESKNHQDDMKNCNWLKCYDFPADMPGSGCLRLEVWDYDDLLSDDLIGSTTIDLEDRYFCARWNELVEKPVEVRPLYHPDEHAPQGDAYIWLEMFPAEERSNPERTPLCIEMEPKTQYEVRFIVWETEDIEMMDIEGTSDVYCLGFFDSSPKDKQSTDIHYRCQTGIASFNWRMLLPFETPALNTTLTLQVYDNDIFCADDYICGQHLELRELIKIPRYLDLPIKLTKSYWEKAERFQQDNKGKINFENKNEDPDGIKFWVSCQGHNGQQSGSVMCSLEILPLWKAKLNPVGKGRDEPNIDPYLPPPFGRFQFTLNPYKLINQLVGPKFRRKCYLIICACLCGIYLSVLIPYVIYHLSAEMVNPF